MKRLMKKLLNKFTKSKSVDSIKTETTIEPIIAGVKWDKLKQELVFKVMDDVPKEKRVYH